MTGGPMPMKGLWQGRPWRQEWGGRSGVLLGGLWIRPHAEHINNSAHQQRVTSTKQTSDTARHGSGPMALVHCYPADLMFSLTGTRWRPVTLPLVRTHHDLILIVQFLSVNVRGGMRGDRRPVASAYHAIPGPRIRGPLVHPPQGHLGSAGVRATSARVFGPPYPSVMHYNLTNFVRALLTDSNESPLHP